MVIHVILILEVVLVANSGNAGEKLILVIGCGYWIMYAERERSYLSLLGGRYGMWYRYRPGSLWSRLE